MLQIACTSIKEKPSWMLITDPLNILFLQIQQIAKEIKNKKYFLQFNMHSDNVIEDARPLLKY